MTIALQCLPVFGRRGAPAGGATRAAAAGNRTASFSRCELRVTVAPAAATTIVFASLDQPNDKLLALLFAAEALRRNGAERGWCWSRPISAYMRQDAAFHEGEAMSQKVVGQLLAALSIAW